MAADVVVTGLGPLLTLEEAKQYLRAEGDDQDLLIVGMIDAAVGQVLAYCNAAIVPIGREAVFKAAALLALRALYDVRDGTTGLPLASMRLVDPYRNLRV